MIGVETLAAAATFFLLAAAPGPATMTVAATAMAHGRRAALAASLGLALSLAAWGAVAAAGFGALLTTSETALTVLKFAGAAVLFWLAIGAAKSAARPGAEATDAPAAARSGFAWFLRGAALNGANPKALVAWGAVVIVGSGADAGAAWTIWAICAALGLAIYVAYSALFAAAPVRRIYARLRRGAEAIVALVFGAAALRLLTWRPEGS